MPLPKPGEQENEKDFIGRCMSDKTTNREFPDNKQRSAVCYAQWRKAHPEAKPEGKKDMNDCKNCKTCGKALAYKSVAVDAAPALTVSPADDGPGFIEGYAAVFGNVDTQGEVIRKGAFAKTIAERIPTGKVKLMVLHLCKGGSTKEVIGTVTQAREDDIGLWIHADLSSDQTSQESRTKAREGHVTGLSIGYQPLAKSETVIGGEIVMELKEIKLLEVTLTPFPANEMAGVTSAKSEIVPEPQPTPAPVRVVTVDWRAAIRRRRLALTELQDEEQSHG